MYAYKVVVEFGGKDVILKNQCSTPRRKVYGVLFNCRGAVIKGNFDVYAKRLKSKGKTTYSTEGIDGGELLWQGW